MSPNDLRLTPSRLARRAIVYVRQSTTKQVESNRESRELQYALVERVHALGWKRVDVVDDDLGLSAGLAATPREGFERTLAAVALGEVGVIMSREVSRLSRTDRDWCRLCEVCQIFDTLLGDAERLYDLASLDDQLVLGIKGTLSVVELKVLRQRLTASIYHKAAKGQLHRTLAPGYVLDGLGHLVKDPNQRVQEAMALIFSTFRTTGSIRQSHQRFHEQGIALPVNAYRGKPTIVFKPPTYGFLSSVLHNPIYAGAYVYGRRPQEIRVQDGILKKRQLAPVAPERARVFLRDHHEGYIDWAGYEENMRVMRSNTRRWDHDDSVGPARRGSGLLAGLLRCGRCGRKLHVRYWGKSGTAARYLCEGDYEAGGHYCLGFGGRGSDQRMAEEVLQVLSPLGMEASLEAMRQMEDAHQARRALLGKQLTQLEYEARRAFEQYDQVDARNRLVASELEARWNEKLQQVDGVRSTITQLEETARPLSEKEEHELRALGTHFRDVWESPNCPPELKKKIVRTVVEEIVVSEEPPGILRFVVHWKGGVHTGFEMPRPRSASQHRTAEADIDLIRRMAQRYGDGHIASVLTRLGRRTGKGKRWSEQRVASLRKREGIVGQARTKPDPEILSSNAAAEQAGVSDTTIRRLVEAGLLRCQQLAPHAPWEIRRQDLESEPVRTIIEHLRRTGKLVLGVSAGAQESLFRQNTE